MFVSSLSELVCLIWCVRGCVCVVLFRMLCVVVCDGVWCSVVCLCVLFLCVFGCVLCSCGYVCVLFVCVVCDCVVVASVRVMRVFV